MHIDINKSRIAADETPRERALRERAEAAEARLAKVEARLEKLDPQQPPKKP